jgi:hypothetical protein
MDTERNMKIFFFYRRSNIEYKTKVIAFVQLFLFHGQNNERRVYVYVWRLEQTKNINGSFEKNLK